MKRDKKTRHYTIQTRWRKSRFGYMSKKPVPEIRISGLWLAAEGFFPKDKIKIEVRKKYLGIETITPAS